MSESIGMMKFPNIWENKVMFQTTNQCRTCVECIEWENGWKWMKIVQNVSKWFKDFGNHGMNLVFPFLWRHGTKKWKQKPNHGKRKLDQFLCVETILWSGAAPKSYNLPTNRAKDLVCTWPLWAARTQTTTLVKVGTPLDPTTQWEGLYCETVLSCQAFAVANNSR